MFLIMDIREQSGATLVLALIVMLMLSLLTIGSLEMLRLNLKIAGNHSRDLQVLYIADAGVEDAIYRLRNDPSWDTGLSDEEFPNGSGNTYTVIIDNITESPSIIITSTGTVSDFQRTIEVKVRITGSSIRTKYWKEI